MLVEVIVSLYVLYYVVSHFLNKSKLPKGPTPLPFIGNIPHLVYEAWKENGIVNAMKSLKKQYGSMYTLWFGPVPTIHIVDYELAKDQMIKHGSKYTLRYAPKVQMAVREGLGIILNDGQVWVDHRRFALQTLRNFGLGRNIMEERIMEEFDRKVNALKSTTSKDEIVLKPGVFYDLLVGNIINQLLFAERFADDSDEFWTLKKLMDDAFEGTTFLDLILPHWLMTSPFFKWRYDRLQLPTIKMKDWIYEKVIARMAAVENGTQVLNDNAEDFTNAYLYKMQQEKDSGIESSFDLDNLVMDLVDLWTAGQETTSTTLTWGTALLLNRPEYIDKIYKEVLAVTKGTRHLSLTDKADTPILNATLNEVQRIASIVSFNLFRRTEDGQSIGGFKVPADVPITAQIAVIMADDTTFPDYEKFEPERFLEDEKKALNVVPFGMGKRACLGESLARAELYLILGNLLLNFDIKPHGVVQEARGLNEAGFLNRPPKIECKFVFRR